MVQPYAQPPRNIRRNGFKQDEVRGNAHIGDDCDDDGLLEDLECGRYVWNNLSSLARKAIKVAYTNKGKAAAAKELKLSLRTAGEVQDAMTRKKRQKRSERPETIMDKAGTE